MLHRKSKIEGHLIDFSRGGFRFYDIYFSADSRDLQSRTMFQGSKFVISEFQVKMYNYMLELGIVHYGIIRN